MLTLVAHISQDVLPTGFWLGLANRGTDGRLEGSISGSDCIYSIVQFLLVTLYHGSSSGCTVHPVVLEAPPLTSGSCHIPWFLGSNHTIALPFVFFPRDGSSSLQLSISEMPHLIFSSAKALKLVLHIKFLLLFPDFLLLLLLLRYN